MSWTSMEAADYFIVCLFKRSEASRKESLAFVNGLEQSVRECSGRIQLRNEKPKEWEVIDGHDHHTEPNHLNPAIFDFNDIVLAAFRSTEDVHTWWNSDQVFNLLKWRSSIEKMGIYMVEGLQQSFDISERNRLSFGDKFILFEFIKMQAFKPMQQYADHYKRLSEKASQEIGVDCNLLFADAVCGTFINEFPLESVCASSWRMKSDANYWYESELYQQSLHPLRKEYALTFTVMIPMCEDKLLKDGRRQYLTTTAVTSISDVTLPPSCAGRGPKHVKG